MLFSAPVQGTYSYDVQGLVSLNQGPLSTRKIVHATIYRYQVMMIAVNSADNSTSLWTCGKENYESFSTASSGSYYTTSPLEIRMDNQNNPDLLTSFSLEEVHIA